MIDMTSSKAHAMERTAMINRVGCIAVFLGVVLIILIAVGVMYMILDGKRRAVVKEFDSLKSIVHQGLDTPRPLGRYVRGEAGFNAVMASIDALQGPLEATETLPELERVYDEFKSKSYEIRRMIDPSRAEDQSVRNQDAQIDGIFNRWRKQREKLVKAIEHYNGALATFPEDMIGRIFGMNEAPLISPTVQENE